MYYIYRILNLVNNKSYIGRTNNLNRRFADHKRLAFTTGHKEYEKTLYRAFRKYGIENFLFLVLEETLNPLEQENYWIKEYDSIQSGYNEGLGGLGGSMPGHCSGENNGRAKLTESDVVIIRENYRNGMSRKECYELFQNKIGISGFADVWQGKTYKEIE